METTTTTTTTTTTISETNVNDNLEDYLEDSKKDSARKNENLAVGSISHILQAAFKDLYSSHENSKLNNSKDSPSKPNDSQDDPSTINTNTFTDKEKEDWDSLQAPKNPYIEYGIQKREFLRNRLLEQTSQAKGLIQYLTDAHTLAQLEDSKETQTLKEQGLIVNKEIPLGKTHLYLEDKEIAKYPLFNRQLTVAHDLIEKNQLGLNQKSRNDIQCSVVVKSNNNENKGLLAEQVEQVIASSSNVSSNPVCSSPEGLGYLKETTSLRIRTKMNQERYPVRIISRTKEKPLVAAVKRMSCEERSKNDKILERIQHCMEFRRNPRFDYGLKSSGMKSMVYNSSHDLTSMDLTSMNLTSMDLTSMDLTCGNDGGVPYFAVTPSTIQYQNYKRGEIYETTLEITNVCYVGRRLRCLSPLTNFFSLSSVKYPDSTGVLSPGLSCKVSVYFSPDSNRDFKDEIQVVHELGMFTIPIQASQETPVLSLPLVLDLGYCFVGDKTTMVFSCENTGGSGEFSILSEVDEEYYDSCLQNNKNMDHEDNYSCQNNCCCSTQVNKEPKNFNLLPFQIEPNAFYLKKGEKIDISITFSPKEIEQYTRKFIVLTDNQKIQNYLLCGKSCQVELQVISIHPSSIEQPQEQRISMNNPFSHDLLFSSSTPGTEQIYILEIYNHTPLSCSFEWTFQQTSCTANPYVDAVNAVEKNVAVASSSSSSSSSLSSSSSTISPFMETFQIVPFNGVFHPKSLIRFTISFLPTSVSHFESIVHLGVKNVPKCAVQGDEQNHYLEILHQQSFPSSDLVKFDATHLGKIGKLQLYGSGDYFQVSLQPSFLLFPENITRNQAYTNMVFLKNKSSSKASFQWTDVLHPSTNKVVLQDDTLCKVEIEPSFGEIEPHQVYPVQVTLVPFQIGKLSLRLLYKIKHNVHCGELYLEANVIGPTIQLQSLQPELNFGLLSVGGQAEQVLQICNPSSIPANYTFAQPGSHAIPTHQDLPRINSNESLLSRFSMASSKDSLNSEVSHLEIPPRALLQFEPEQGVLEPYSQAQVKITCLAGKFPERLRTCLECAIENGNTQYLGVRGEIQTPMVYVTPLSMNLGNTFIGVPVSQTFHLINLSNLEAGYKWLLAGRTSKNYSVHFTPKKGILKSKEQAPITITYTPLKPGRMEALLACNVRGMLVPLGIQLCTIQKSLVISFYVVKEDKEIPFCLKTQHNNEEENHTNGKTNGESTPLLPKLLFGENISIFERRKLKLVICNSSGIATTFTLTPAKYPDANQPGAGCFDEHVIEKEQQSKMSEHPKTRKGSSLMIPSFQSSTMDKLPSSSSSLTHGDDSPRRRSTSSTKKPLLGDQHEITNVFASEAGKKYIKESSQVIEDRKILHHGKGIAFQCIPSSGHLKPWDHCVIDITCFNDMAGHYVDELICHFPSIPPIKIPITAIVEGCPLQLDKNCVGLDTSSQPPLLKWGEVLPNTTAPSKSLRVLNKGPSDCFLKWNITNLFPIEKPLVHIHWDINDKGYLHLSWNYIHNEKDEATSIFSIQPMEKLIPKYSSQVFQLGLKSPNEADIHPKYRLTAYAEWRSPLIGKLVEGGINREEDQDNILVAVESSDQDKYPVVEAVERHDPENPVVEAVESYDPEKQIVKVKSIIPSSLQSTRDSTSCSSLFQLKEIKACLTVDCTAKVITPYLHLDQKKDLIGKQVIHFKVFSTCDLDDRSYHRTIVLVNRMKTTLTFTLSIMGPFQLLASRTRAPQTPPPPPQKLVKGSTLSFHHLSIQDKKTIKKNKKTTLLKTKDSGPKQVSQSLDRRYVNKNESFESTSISKENKTKTNPIHYGYSLSSGMQVEVDLLFHPSLSSTVDPSHLKQQFEGKLMIHYANDLQQEFQLCGAVFRPILVLSPSEMKFGIVQVNQIRSSILHLGNPTFVPAEWSIEHISLSSKLTAASQTKTLGVQQQSSSFKNAQDDPQVFVFAHSSGRQVGPTVPLESAGYYLPKQEPKSNVHIGNLQIQFQPKDAVEYRSRYRFHVRQGQSFDLVVTGKGTFDEYIDKEQQTQYL